MKEFLPIVITGSAMMAGICGVDHNWIGALGWVEATSCALFTFAVLKRMEP